MAGYVVKMANSSDEKKRLTASRKFLTCPEPFAERHIQRIIGGTARTAPRVGRSIVEKMSLPRKDTSFTMPAG